MDKETVKRLAEESGFDLLPNGEGKFIVEDRDSDGSAIFSFAQACCDWQKDKDARVCDYIAASHLEFVGDAADCADAIRNAKENPESDIERATNLR